MKLADIGEFGFIGRFASKFDGLIDETDQGIGDDCAIVSISDTEAHVITTDLLIEDVHFLKDRISPEELGYKSLAVNLSDIAAMGAQPLYSFLSIGIPKDTDVEYLDRFMEGYRQLSEKYGVPLMGGDTTKSNIGLVINVAVVGRGKKCKLRQREMAKKGDLICVTGNLGASAGGLKVLLDDLELNDTNSELVQAHHLPEPQINEGIWLAQQKGVHAMMDISDGISSDLLHILKASEVSAIVHLDKIPVSSALLDAAMENGWSIYDLATGGGEDYQLLFTIDKDEFKKTNEAFSKEFGKPIFAIGEIKNGDPEITWRENNLEITKDKSGFDHFA